MPELAKGCVDMTNGSSTYLSIAIGAVVGALITWWVYKIQKNANIKQEETLRLIRNIEESHDKVLKSTKIIRKEFLVKYLFWTKRLML